MYHKVHPASFLETKLKMAENCESKSWKESNVMLTILLTIAITIVVAAMTKLIDYIGTQSSLNYSREALYNVENFRTPDNNVSGGSKSPDYSPQKIYPSRNDKKEYLFRVIPNNHLRVLLVRDTTVTTSAAAMSVGVGRYDDPTTHEGLAHLCEHMLDHGTEKYPDVESYKRVVENYGGQSLASTAPDLTLYSVTVPHIIFPTTLDIFAHFFISPLFPEDILHREIEAIHHEYLRNINQYGYKWKRLLNYVWNPKNPGHKFGIGDNTTLNKEDILSQLKRFFNDKYSASNVSSTKISHLIMYASIQINKKSFCYQIFSSVLVCYYAYCSIIVPVYQCVTVLFLRY